MSSLTFDQLMPIVVVVLLYMNGGTEYKQPSSEKLEKISGERYVPVW